MKNYLFFIEISLIMLLTTGTLAILKDNYKQNQGCLTFTLDDGLASQYITAYPLLKENNFSATFFIIANITKDLDDLNRSFMNKAQVKELIENNFEIGSHTLTHSSLTELNEEQVEREIKLSKELLENLYNIKINSFAFPYTHYNKRILTIAEKYYKNIRIAKNEKQYLLMDIFALKRENNIKLACDEINKAKKEGTWLIFILHDIIENPKLWDTSISDFKDVLKCAKESQIKVDSFSECKINYPKEFN